MARSCAATRRCLLATGRGAPLCALRAARTRGRLVRARRRRALHDAGVSDSPVTHADGTGRLQTVTAADNGVPAWMCWCWPMCWCGAARAAVRESSCCDLGPAWQTAGAGSERSCTTRTDLWAAPIRKRAEALAIHPPAALAVLMSSERHPRFHGCLDGSGVLCWPQGLGWLR